MNIPVTEWFLADVKPVHVGCYETRGSKHKWFWDGKVWRSATQGWECCGQFKVWRGLTSPHPEWKP